MLSEAADVEYKCTRYYERDDEAGIRWNDADLAIEWPVSAPRLSERDRHNPTLGAFLSEVP